MVAARVSALILRAVPAALLALLAAWVVADAIQVPAGNPAWILIVVVGLGVLAGLGGVLRPIPALRRLALLFLLCAFVAVRVAYLGVDLPEALAFLTLAISSVPVRSLAEHFSAVLAMDLDQDLRARVRGALARAIFRVVLACGLAVLVPLVAADLALAGTVPSTSVATAVILAGGVIALVLLLALLPTLERRTA